MTAAVLVPLGLAAAVLTALWLLYILPDGFPLCPMKRVTGLNCPLCGGTHAVRELLRGNPAAAFSYNPAVMAAMLPCCWMYARLIGSCVSRPFRPYRPTLSRWTIAAIIAGVVVFTIVRNTPVYKAYLF